MNKADRITSNIKRYKRNGVALSSLELSIYKFGFNDGILFEKSNYITILKKKLSKAKTKAIAQDGI